MWRGYEEALGAYGIAICREWQRRGHADTCADKITDDLAAAGPAVRLARTSEIR
jgi:ribosomal protein S18 acetylase RimI-like enzyme